MSIDFDYGSLSQDNLYACPPGGNLKIAGGEGKDGRNDYIDNSRSRLDSHVQQKKESIERVRRIVVFGRGRNILAPRVCRGKESLLRTIEFS